MTAATAAVVVGVRVVRIPHRLLLLVRPLPVLLQLKRRNHNQHPNKDDPFYETCKTCRDGFPSNHYRSHHDGDGTLKEAVHIYYFKRKGDLMKSTFVFNVFNCFVFQHLYNAEILKQLMAFHFLHRL